MGPNMLGHARRGGAHANIDNTVNTTAINGEMSINNQCPLLLPPACACRGQGRPACIE